MSEFTLLLRELTDACAPKITAKVAEVVVNTIRSELPSMIEAYLCEKYPGERISHTVTRRPVGMRRMRDQAIRAEYTGRNVKELAKKYGLSARMVFKIVSLAK